MSRDCTYSHLYTTPYRSPYSPSSGNGCPYDHSDHVIEHDARCKICRQPITRFTRDHCGNYCRQCLEVHRAREFEVIKNSVPCGFQLVRPRDDAAEDDPPPRPKAPAARKPAQKLTRKERRAIAFQAS